MRGSLAGIAETAPALGPIAFATDRRGAETCTLANGIVIGWHAQAPCVTDTRSGFVDTGPFAGFEDMCRLVASVCQ